MRIFLSKNEGTYCNIMMADTTCRCSTSK